MVDSNRSLQAVEQKRSSFYEDELVAIRASDGASMYLCGICAMHWGLMHRHKQDGYEDRVYWKKVYNKYPS